MSRGWWIVVLLIAGPAAGRPDAGGEPWRELGTVRQDTLFVALDRLTAVALARNEMLAAADALADAAAADADAAWSGFLPRVTLGASYLRSDDALNAFGYKLTNRRVGAADFAPDALNHPGEVDQWVAQVRLDQPVFDGGVALAGKQAADAARRAARYRHARARDTVRLQAVEVHEGLRLAQAMTTVLEAAIRSAEGHERRAAALVDAEMATAADLLQARVFLASLRQELIVAHNRAAAAADAVQLLTALDVPLPMAAAGGATAPQPPDAPDPAAVAASRGDLLAAEQQARAAGKKVGAATGALLPRVDLSVQRDWFSQDRFLGQDAASWTLGVHATWRVFDGLQSLAGRRQARAERRAAEHAWQQQARAARQEVLQAWRDAQAAAQRFAVAQAAVDAARESLRIVDDQYAEGLATMTDLLDVQAAAIAAAGDLAVAQHDVNLGRARLAHATGSSPAEGGTP